MTKTLCAVLGGVVLALASGCADKPEPGAPVAGEELPSKLTITLERSPQDGASTSVIRTLNAELISPDDVPLHGLKWPRLVPSEGSPWPPGWRVLPGEIPFGGATGGIPAGRRLSWSMDVMRTTPSAPTSAELSLSLEYAKAGGGSAARATSDPVRIDFPSEAVPHGIGEQDVLSAAGGDILLRVLEARPGSPTSFIEIRPGGAYRAKSGSADPDAAQEVNGVLNEEQLTRLRETLEQTRIWELMSVKADAGPGGEDTFVSVVLAMGDAGSLLQVRGSTLRDSASWPTVAKLLTEFTSVAIQAK